MKKYKIQQKNYGSKNWSDVFETSDMSEAISQLKSLGEQKRINIETKGFCEKLSTKFRLVRIENVLIREI